MNTRSDTLILIVSMKKHLMIDSKFINKIFDQLEGEYSIERLIGNDGIGKGFARFIKHNNSSIDKTLLYKEGA
ncbi:MAG: hypothetical protein LN588_03315 [Rickettsia endosymbiont of Bryobia graminum]|nr:hypothetical protein [Rickettsia endosymbiont of Bryobia graminum]